MRKIIGRLPLQPLGVTGLLILLTLTTLAIFADPIAPYDPTERVALPFQPPSADHWLGTNDIGQDILSEIIFGTRISLTLGLSAATLAVLIGTTIGAIAGYGGGSLDALLMRLADLVLAAPFLPLMIVLAAYLGPSFTNIILVIGLLSWARTARVIRAQMLTLRERDYVQASRALGASHLRVLRRHLLPALVPLCIGEFVLIASNAILIEASLSFLGLGDPTAKSWGTILFYAQARSAFLTGTWRWWVVPPGLLITLTVLGFAFVGYSLEDRFNPRLRR